MTRILLLLLLFEGVCSVEFECETRTVDALFLSCRCRSFSPGYNDDRFQGLASLLSRQLDPPGRPRQRKISQISFSDCSGRLRLVYDLDKLDRQVAQVTDITFENIGDLILRFEGIQEPRTTFIFTDIDNLQILGLIPGRGNMLRWFFRDVRRDKGTNIVFDDLLVEGTIQLLSFQDIASLTVLGTSLERLQDIEFFHVDKCFDSLSTRPVVCTKDLFLSRDFPSDPDYPPRPPGPDYPPRPPGPDYPPRPPDPDYPPRPPDPDYPPRPPGPDYPPRPPGPDYPPRPLDPDYPPRPPNPDYPPRPPDPNYPPRPLDPEYPPVPLDPDSRPRPTRYPPDYPTSTNTNGTPLPYSSSSEVTSNPIFIVGMVLLAALILIAIPVILYVRHQNRGGTWRVGFPSDNWFLRPSSHNPRHLSFRGSAATAASRRHDLERSSFGERSTSSSESADSPPLSVSSIHFQEARSGSRV